MLSRIQTWLAVFIALVTSCIALTTSYIPSYNQPVGHFHPYDRYERGFLADPNGYESRNTYQPSKTLPSYSSPSNVGAVLSKVSDKRSDMIASEYRTQRKSKVNDLGVVYRKHLKEDFIGKAGSHGNARRGSDTSSYGGYTSYYDNSARHGDSDYATRNAESRYNTMNTGTGWVSASTRSYGNAQPRSGYRYEIPDYNDSAGDRTGVELIGRHATGSNQVRYPSGRERNSVTVREYAVEPSQTPGGGYLTSQRPWYLRRLEGKEAIAIDDYELEVTRDPRDNTIQRMMQPIVLNLLSAYDPCIEMADGDYPLTSSFETLFPYVDQRCNFVKCAHRVAFLNACGIGTRNPDPAEYKALDDSSARYCSLADTSAICRALILEKETQVEELSPPGGHDQSSLTDSPQEFYEV